MSKQTATIEIKADTEQAAEALDALTEKAKALNAAREPLLQKLKSRKFWLTLVGSFAVTALAHFGLDPESADRVMYLVMAYLGVQGYQDAKKP